MDEPSQWQKECAWGITWWFCSAELKPAVKSHLRSVGAGRRACLWSVPEMPTPVNIQRNRTFPSSAGTSGGHLLFKQTESSLAVLTNLNCVCVSNQVYVNILNYFSNPFIFREMVQKPSNCCLGLWHVSYLPAHSVDRYFNNFQKLILHKYPSTASTESLFKYNKAYYV